MRTLSSNALTKIATKLGTEPLVIIEVEWGSGVVSYADRTIGSIKGNILEVANLDSVIDVQKSSNSQQISVVLSDTRVSPGELKGIFDTQDIHERPVRVYQWFTGLDLSDKFLLFSGKISSPIKWSEADRTLSFDVLSALEDKEFGFSAEEGEFPFVPKDLVGKAWPVIFGTVLDYPALQINKAVSGSTLCGVGILSGRDLQEQVPLGGSDCSQGMSIAMMSEQISLYNVGSSKWQDADPERSDALREQANNVLSQMVVAIDQQAAQLACGAAERRRVLDDAETNGQGCNPVRILGGEDFPQNTPIELNINGGLFTGKMVNDEFTILSRRHPTNDDKAQQAYDNVSTCENATPTQFFDMQLEVPPGSGDFDDASSIRRHGFIVCHTPQASRPATPQVAQNFWAEPGSRAVMSSDEPISYIVSITPGTVLSVKAYKTLNGERKLVNVPNDLWSVEVKNYGAIQATVVTTVRPLSSIVDQNWNDDLYITFRSDIGPNTVEIMEWIIENYTSLEPDPVSFAAVETLVEPFPMNFPVLDRRNTVDLLKDIAFQARCAMWISNGIVYLKYLPIEPSADQTVSLDDIEVSTIEVELTPTEDIVTKMIVSWRLTWEDKDPVKVILRNNVPKYGTKTEEYDFFCYNQPDSILKVATFWLIRKSNTWKRISFRGFLNLLKLETYDTMNLSLPGYVASGAVKAIVESSQYDSANNAIDFECLVPVRAGEMVQYKFYWPSTLTVDDTFESNASNTGVTGELPIGYVDWEGGSGQVWAGGVNIVFGQRTDRGDRTPTDVGFTAQTVVPENVFANLTNVVNPNPNLLLNYLDAMPAMQVPGLIGGTTVIDIRKTKIIDSSKPSNNPSARLDSFFREVNQDGELVMNSTVKASDGTNPANFVIEHDSEDNEYGAKIAYVDES